MVARYPEFFDPPLPIADRMAGCAAYSAYERHFDIADVAPDGVPLELEVQRGFPLPGHVPAVSTTIILNGLRRLREPPVERQRADGLVRPV